MKENQQTKGFNGIEGKSVFGCYSQNENKVTLALLKILERAEGDGLLRDLIEAAEGEDLPSSDIELTSQVTDTDENSIPDGRIRCNYSFDFFIESKLDSEINDTQLSEHLKTLESHLGSKLIYITKHTSRPQKLVGKDNVLWCNWTKVTDCLNNYLKENDDTILEYLIQQFELLVKDKKVDAYDDSENRVIIVGGRNALPVALKYHFYACQPNRAFKNARYIAFLCEKKISHLFKIEEIVGESVDLKQYPDVVSPDYFEDSAFFKEDDVYKSEPRKLFKLSEEKDAIKSPIVDDSVSKTGKHCAFVQRQGYTTLEKIKSAEKTSDFRD